MKFRTADIEWVLLVVQRVKCMKKMKLNNLNDLARAVSLRADTDGIKLNAVEVKRSLSVLFKVLKEQPAAVVLGLMAKWLAR